MIRRSALAACLLWAFEALAGYNPGASDNIAIYWGQNSAGVTNSDKSQKSLADYCSNTDVDIIPIAFVANLNPIQVDLTNMGSGENIGKEIASCQKAGKTILLSVGGATFTTGPSSPQQAQSLADQLWSMFGPPGGDGGNRPFGDAVIDGFDLDIEAPLQNLAPFAARLRENMDKANGNGDKKFYLSAAPQCPYPDLNNQDMLQGDSAVAFDFVMVQFYNNAKCDIRVFGSAAGEGNQSTTHFNMDEWDRWARSSKNPNAKIFLGIPGGPTAVSSSQKASYKAPNDLGPVIAYSKKYSSFGGVMVWDMSQVWANPGFLDAISSDLKSSPATNENTARQSNNASAQRVRRTHQRDWKP